jgi:multiple sugar transport system permease protein
MKTAEKKKETAGETSPRRTVKKLWDKSNDQVADMLRSIGFLGPSVLGVAVFFIVPFLVVVYYSVIRSPLNPEFVFLDNFKAVLQNSSFRTAAKNTAVFSAVAVPLAVVLSLGLALILECRIPCKSLFRTFFLSPMMVPVASVVLIWQVIFHYNGTLNAFLSHFGVEPINWLNSSYSLGVIVVLFLWKNLGYNMILFMAALNNIPKELLEVADVEGASAVHKFFAIKLRYLSPTVLFVTILSIINSFKVFREIYLLVGQYPYEGLYMMQHFMNNTFANLDYQKMSTAAVLLALVMVGLIALLFKIEDVFGKDVEG